MISARILLTARLRSKRTRLVLRKTGTNPAISVGRTKGSAPTLRDRLPADLRESALRPEFDALPFSPLYVTDDEMAAEIANRTVHGIMHMGWVREGTGGYRGQMAVYVKPNGLLGEGYLAAIKPFRHLIVYPAMLRDIGRRWEGGP